MKTCLIRLCEMAPMPVFAFLVLFAAGQPATAVGMPPGRASERALWGVHFATAATRCLWSGHCFSPRPTPSPPTP